MQRSQGGQLAHIGLHLGADPHGRAKALAAVHDAMSDRLSIAERRVQRLTQRALVDLRLRRGQLALAEHRITAIQQRELEAARARVDDEHAHRAHARSLGPCSCESPGEGSPEPGQVHSRSCAESSPCSRVKARWRRRSSLMCWRRCAARSRSPETRSITSITRWKRSRSLSITMSNGVVVVPSSLYPRTWICLLYTSDAADEEDSVDLGGRRI